MALVFLVLALTGGRSPWPTPTCASRIRYSASAPRLWSHPRVGLLLDTRSGRLVALSAHTVVRPVPGVQHRARRSLCLRRARRHRVVGRALGGPRPRQPERHLARRPPACRRRRARPFAPTRGFAFGGGDAWLVADERGAGPAARNETNGEIVHSTTGLLALPSAGDPQATIYRRADGRWLVELGAELRTLSDRAQLDLAGARWSLFLPSELGQVPTTLKAEGSALVLADVTLLFAPSLDEEHVDVRVRTDDGKEWPLPPRSSHYVLLTLARIRLEDARSGMVPEEQGWIYASRLADMLQYTLERLNLEIFRARSLFAKLGFADATHLVERRTVNRQLRIGVPGLHVPVGSCPHLESMAERPVPVRRVRSGRSRCETAHG